MVPNDRVLLMNGDGRVQGGSSKIADVVVNKQGGRTGPWQSRLSKDRPSYACPKCSKEAMQFYADHPSVPGRSDFFHCHACGMCWDI